MPKYWRETQFWTVDGAPRYGMCGPNAAAMAESFALQRYVWTGDLYRRLATAKRLSDADGATTIWELDDQLVADGFDTILRGFIDAPWPDWAQWFWYQITAGHAAILETSNGEALKDAISGLGENARNLQYHYILLCRYHNGGISLDVNRDLPAGFWCADGCNLAQGSGLQVYPLTVLDAAQPRAGLAIIPKPREVSPVIPQGYTDDGTVLSAPNGMQIAGVVRAEWLNNPVKYGDPIEAKETMPNYTEYLFYNGLMADDSRNGTSKLVIGGAGQRAHDLELALNQANAKIAEMQAAQTPAASATLSTSDQSKIAFADQLLALVREELK